MGILTMSFIRGIGSASIRNLIGKFSSLAEIATCPIQYLPSNIPTRVKQQFAQEETWYDAHFKMQNTLDDCIKNNVEIMTLFDSSYPFLLKSIPNPPVLLYVKGKLENDRRAVACIGTRNPSGFGKKVAERISRMLSSNGWTIVSGLATGIDQICHEAALQSGGRTIAVVANGLDHIYPKSNYHLASRIVETGGALISEQPFGVKAAARNLIQRNRIQSGLSLGTFIMQSDVIGGSIHTVKYTLLQNRLLFAPLPTGEHALEKSSAGILALIKYAGPKLVEELTVNAQFQKLLIRDYLNEPPAIAITGSKDYSSVLKSLEQKLQDSYKNRNECNHSRQETLFDFDEGFEND